MPKQRLHLIGNAHIDPVWLWTAAEGRQEVIDTCASALDRIAETGGFVFCRSSAATYLWLGESRPDLYEAMASRIAEGRWVVAGGWWVQPDCNTPSGEALVRQALVGKAYFREQFGVDPLVGYNVDTFGHPATLPQILRGTGARGYLFFRPGPGEKELPGTVFRWRAPDGAEVVGIRPVGHYNTGPGEIEERIRQAADGIEPGLADGIALFGVGNHGGGPTKANIASIESLRGDDGLPELAFSDPDTFLAAVEAANADLPVVEDELQYHARGCYTSVSAIKRANREAENALLDTEMWSVVAQELAKRPIPRERLREWWRTVLFNQFHDILAGTSIRSACDEAIRENQLVVASARATAVSAARAVAARTDTAFSGGEALVVFNPLPWARDEVIEAEVNWRRAGRGIAVSDADGSAHPVQLLGSLWSGGGRRVRLLIEPRIPACGYAVLRVTEAEEASDGRSPRNVDSVSNGLLRVDLTGGPAPVAGIEDSELGVRVVCVGALGLVVLRDNSDTWSHDVASFRDEIGQFEWNDQAEVIEWGPLRWTVRVEGSWESSWACQEIGLAAGRRQVDVRLEVDWHERHKMLKLAVPTAIVDGVASYEVPYGVVMRAATGEEEPAQRWVDVSGSIVGASGGRVPYGVALLNDCKYGFDVLGSEMRMSVLRSPIYAFHDPAQVQAGESYEYTDQGRQVVRYSIVPHAGDWREGEVVKRAAELNRPVLALHEPAHEGPLPRTYSFVGTDAPNVHMEAVKPTEVGEGFVLRVRETEGKATECMVRVPGGEARVALRGWEIKTLVVRGGPDDRAIVETDMLER